MKLNNYCYFFLSMNLILFAQDPQDILHEFIRINNNHQKEKIELKNDIYKNINALEQTKKIHQNAPLFAVGMHRSSFAGLAASTLILINSPFMLIKSEERKNIQLWSGTTSVILCLATLISYAYIHYKEQQQTKDAAIAENKLKKLLIESTLL